MNITVDDFISNMVDSSFFHLQIWDVNKEVTVYDGMADDVPENLLDSTIWSIDCPVVNRHDASLCVNIDTSEEW